MLEKMRYFIKITLFDVNGSGKPVAVLFYLCGFQKEFQSVLLYDIAWYFAV